MKNLFDNVSVACSRLTTRAYSTSFSLGIRFLGKKLHSPIYAIYGFVRFADEIVDSFHDYDKASLLQEFRAETWKAIERKISINPILNSFQEVVHTYGINHALIESFFKSMEADLHFSCHTRSSYNDYIFGSAEAVGLMCLHVFADGDSALYERLTPPAKKLGAAFQKVNFLRDVRTDFRELGRMYFPGVNFERFSNSDKHEIQAEIESDFREALFGIRQLPHTSRRGVYLAYMYYRKLFAMISNTPADRVLNARIRIPNYRKIGLMFQSLLRHQFNMI